MRALTYHGAQDVKVDTVPDTVIEASDDIILRVTATVICGSDLKRGTEWIIGSGVQGSNAAPTE